MYIISINSAIIMSNVECSAHFSLKSNCHDCVILVNLEMGYNDAQIFMKLGSTVFIVKRTNLRYSL